MSATGDCNGSQTLDVFRAQTRAAAILKILNALYPQVKPQLFYRNPFELLVATILSAQCTDNQVNRVTPGSVQAHAHAASTLRKRLSAEIEGLVRPTGFYRNKARNIKACCEALIERHGGTCPGRWRSWSRCRVSGARPPTWCSAPPSTRRASWWTPTWGAYPAGSG